MIDGIALIQGTDEWKAARIGSLGASSLHEALARTKTGWGAGRANCRARLVIERLTGIAQDTYVNAAMQAGIDNEPDARTAYEFVNDADVMQIGLARHPTLAHTHASPDGLVGADGLIEIKCPQPAQHLATLEGEPIADKYQLQMLWQMRCCDRAWCDFVSYSPAFPAHLRLHVRRFHRDEKRMAIVEKDVSEFLVEVDEAVDNLNRRYGMAPADVVRGQLERGLA